MATTAKRVRCGGCGRKMAQSVPKNRDHQGRTWHFDCLADVCGSRREHFLAKWAADKKRNGWKKSEER